MKRIKDLTVTVRNTVELHDVEVPDEVYDALFSASLTGKEIPRTEFITGSRKLRLASEWLSRNIDEIQANDWDYIINELKTNNHGI